MIQRVDAWNQIGDRVRITMRRLGEKQMAAEVLVASSRYRVKMQHDMNGSYASRGIRRRETFRLAPLAQGIVVLLLYVRHVAT